MIFTWKRQADEAARLLDAVRDLHGHVNDLMAGADFVEAEARLRHAIKVLGAHEEAP